MLRLHLDQQCIQYVPKFSGVYIRPTMYSYWNVELAFNCNPEFSHCVFSLKIPLLLVNAKFNHLKTLCTTNFTSFPLPYQPFKTPKSQWVKFWIFLKREGIFKLVLYKYLWHLSLENLTWIEKESTKKT